MGYDLAKNRARSDDFNADEVTMGGLTRRPIVPKPPRPSKPLQRPPNVIKQDDNLEEMAFGKRKPKKDSK